MIITAIGKKILKRYRPNPDSSNIISDYTSIGNSIHKDLYLRLDNPQFGRKYITIGDDCIISGTFIFESKEGEVVVGNHTFIGGSTFISRSKIQIGDNVNIAWGCTFYDHDSHSIFAEIRRKDLDNTLKDMRNGRNPCYSKDWSVVKTAPITIQNDAWIGMNCIILKGVTIGEGAIIGAGSVVTKDIPAWHLAAGNPARVIREISH